LIERVGGGTLKPEEKAFAVKVLASAKARASRAGKE